MAFANYADIIKVTEKVLLPQIVGNVFKESPFFSWLRHSRMAESNAIYNVAAHEYGYKGWTAQLSMPFTQEEFYGRTR